MKNHLNSIAIFSVVYSLDFKYSSPSASHNTCLVSCITWWRKRERERESRKHLMKRHSCCWNSFLSFSFYEIPWRHLRKKDMRVRILLHLGKLTRNKSHSSALTLSFLSLFSVTHFLIKNTPGITNVCSTHRVLVIWLSFGRFYAMSSFFLFSQFTLNSLSILILSGVRVWPQSPPPLPSKIKDFSDKGSRDWRTLSLKQGNEWTVWSTSVS